MVYEDYFVHAEKIYTLESNGYLVKLSFGSFDRPEHKYLLITHEGIEYYPIPPVASNANYKAHKKIEEWIHG